MTDQAKGFFGELERRGNEPLLEQETGVIRFDIVDDGHSERWIVTIDHGDIGISRSDVPGDCRLRVPAELFERIARGEANAVSAMFRGELEAEGDWHLLVLTQRLFRRPADAPR